MSFKNKKLGNFILYYFQIVSVIDSYMFIPHHSFFFKFVFCTFFNIPVRIAPTYNYTLSSTNAVVQLYSMISHNIYRTIFNGKKLINV